MENKPQGFSPFSWAIAIFCLPILLWPLALLISPNLLKNPNLSEGQSTAMSIFLWLYPFLLGIVARLIFKLQQRQAKAGKTALILAFVLFYSALAYVVTGFHS